MHLLRSDELELAHRFADREAPDKFAGLEWGWDEDVPELAGTLAYLRCRRAENFVRYDHTVLIGDLERGRLEDRRAARLRAPAHGLADAADALGDRRQPDRR